MPILGAHMSTTGGYYKAVERALASGCDCVQIFCCPNRRWPTSLIVASVQAESVRFLTKPDNKWRTKEIASTDVKRFEDALSESAVSHPLSHSSYLINLAAPDDALWKQSIDALVVELHRAAFLRVPYVVLHPGSFTTSSEQLGIKRIAAGLNEVHAQTSDLPTNVLLETTAGQGSCLGWQFEQLAEMMEQVADGNRLGICLDTCHVFAAGYEIHHEKGYRATMRDFDSRLGLHLIKAIHLNDSKKPLGSRVDRHDHIGKGEIGLDAFRFLLNDSRFSNVPMYLETPKEGDGEKDWDAANLKVLRKLVD